MHYDKHAPESSVAIPVNSLGGVAIGKTPATITDDPGNADHSTAAKTSSAYSFSRCPYFVRGIGASRFGSL